MLVVIAKMVVNPGKSNEFIKNVEKLAPPTRDFPGCLSYELLQSDEDENVFIFHETWENEEAFEKHFDTDANREFAAGLDGVAAKDVEPYICHKVL